MIKKNLIKIFFLSLLLLNIFTFHVYAYDIVADIVVDKAYELYLTPDLSNPFYTFMGGAYNSPVSQHYAFDLIPGVTNYLHIIASGDIDTAGFLGSFKLNNDSFLFSNGLSEITSNTNDWLVTAGGYGPGNPDFVLSPVEVNGPALVSNYPSILSSSKWIWTNQYGNGDLGYVRSFVAPINSAVPEPATLSLLGLGLLGLVFRRNKVL